MDVGRINSHDWAVGVRGQNDQFANKLLVIQDGRSLYTPLNGGVYWDTVDYVLADVDRIEVIRGPGGTLWGANAVNGVINITSKDSRDTQGWLLSSRVSNDDSNVALRYGGKLSDDTFYRVYFKTTYEAGLDDPAGGNASDNWYGVRGGFRIDKHPDDNDTITLQGDLASNRMHERGDVLIPTPPFAVPTNFGRTDATGNVLARWDHRTGEDSDFSLQMYYDYLKSTITSRTSAPTHSTLIFTTDSSSGQAMKWCGDWAIGWSTATSPPRPSSRETRQRGMTASTVPLSRTP